MIVSRLHSHKPVDVACSSEQLSIDSMCQIMLCRLVKNGMPLEQMANLLQMDIVVMTLMYVLVSLG